MKIKTLKDLKDALAKIPSDRLEEFGVGFSEDDEIVSLLVWCDEEDFVEKWDKMKKDFPIIKDVSTWIKNIGKTQQKMIESEGDWDGEGFEDMISSEDFKDEDDKKSSDSQDKTLKQKGVRR